LHFRRGLSRKEQVKWEKALEDFEKVLVLDPEQKDVKECDTAKKKLGKGKKKGSKRMTVVETDVAEVDAVEAGDSFIGSSTFEGAKPGYVFQMGPHGVGYYPDPAALKKPAGKAKAV